MKQYNRDLSSQRVVIENVFGFLKNLWRCIGLKYTRNLYRISDVFRVCCLLSNFLFHTRQVYPRSPNFDVLGGVQLQVENELVEDDHEQDSEEEKDEDMRD